jgi:hypothetical protein
VELDAEQPNPGSQFGIAIPNAWWWHRDAYIANADLPPKVTCKAYPRSGHAADFGVIAVKEISQITPLLRRSRPRQRCPVFLYA